MASLASLGLNELIWQPFYPDLNGIQIKDFIFFFRPPGSSQRRGRERSGCDNRSNHHGVLGAVVSLRAHQRCKLFHEYINP